MAANYLLGVTYFLVCISWLSNTINAASILKEPSKFQAPEKQDGVETKCQKGKPIWVAL